MRAIEKVVNSCVYFLFSLRLLSFISPTYNFLNLQLATSSTNNLLTLNFLIFSPYFFPLMVKSNKKDQACTVLSWKLPRQSLRDLSRASCLLGYRGCCLSFLRCFLAIMLWGRSEKWKLVNYCFLLASFLLPFWFLILLLFYIIFTFHFLLLYFFPLMVKMY